VTAPLDVSIVIVSWNTRALVLDCLASLASAVGGLTFEVVLIDNASADDTVAEVRRLYPSVVIVENRENRGFAAANNQGIGCSHGRYTLLLNSDTVAEPRSIETLVRFADSEPRSGAVGGMLLEGDGRFQASFQKAPSILRECLSASGLGPRLWFHGYPSYGPAQSRARRQVDVIPGACMLLRREALDDVGLLDESYFMYSEETDLCRRLHVRRWEVWYVPEARITHLGGQSTRQMRTAMVLALYRSKVRYMAIHHGALHALALRTLFTIILRVKRLVAEIRPATRGRVPLVRWSDLAHGG
jgi:N-acetylglucosaminyl-diphospho-decaprenol L-rhamnosyltransferase